HKHHNIAKRAVERGGRRDIYLGSRECQGYVEACEFGNEKSFYDGYAGEISFGPMFHGFNYPDESGDSQLEARIWMPVMKEKGIIQFERPEHCPVVRPVKKKDTKIFTIGENLKSVDEEYEEIFSREVER